MQIKGSNRHLTRGESKCGRRNRSAWPLILIVILAALSIAASGFYLPYLWQAARGQLKLVAHRQSIEDAVKSGALSEVQRDKIRFIQEAKQFAEERIGLKKTGNYRSVVILPPGPVAHVISAAMPDALEPYSWRFPIVGQVDYLGFFDYEMAVVQEEKLKREGYDTLLRGASAFSTLGWFDDPVFSAMLKRDPPDLAEVIIHELTHATLYLKDQTEFNEGMATFVGFRGAIDFLEEKYGRDSEYAARARENMEDAAAFSAFIQRTYQRLDSFYNAPGTREDKIAGRGDIFRESQVEFEGVLAAMHRPYYSRYLRIELNNAVFLSLARYHVSFEDFEALYRKLDNDLKATVAWLVQMAKEHPDDPIAALKAFADNDLD
jgi:predicted aminopeptidase